MAEESGLLGAVAAVGGTIGRAVGDMFAAEERLGQTLASGPASGQKFEVTKETVLQAGKIISDQVSVLAKKLSDAKRDLIVVLAPGSDEVNQAIAGAWNSRLVGGETTYAGRIEMYMASLDQLAAQLREAATQYGFTEEEVTSAFGATGAK